MTVHESSKMRILALILAVLIALYALLFVIPAPQNYSGENPLLVGDGLPKIVAHRGGRDEFTQNTLEAFYNAYSVDENVMMETDVNLTKDGVLILLHNELLDATTNVTGLVSEWNYTDLIGERVNFGYDNPTEDTVLAGEREYFTVGGERRFPTDVTYPEGIGARDEEIYLATTFEELLAAFPNNFIDVEIKQRGELGRKALAEAVRLIEKYDAFERVSILSFYSEVNKELVRMKRDGSVPESFMYAPGIVGIVTYYALTTLGMDSLFYSRTALLQLPVENFGFKFATEKVVRAAHKHNMAVHYWTVNDADEMRYLIELRVDGIMTDNPTLMKQVLDEYG